ncbi:MAG: DNA mismatch repair endonuclease MutL [Candidatus Aminicenantes bacterium]|nr:DNA mismatch repair endonuclease MutL [Candidatus Aminicenantes bacterium]
MKRISVLPPEISQKIAAGEVIERPVSVVKELVENSLDAGATEIDVDLLAGGKKLIRVRDDGHGMSREDAEICFVRHSTSKIAREEDLLEISTLGFRGEALPSISSVSRLTLRTSDGAEGPGTEIEREGEAALSVKDAAAPRGTTVEARDLFFNLPARLKFLRGDQAELGQIVKYLTNVALAYPGLRLTLDHGPRNILDCPPVAGLKERLFQLYGKSLLDKLMEIDYEEDGNRLHGFASLPPMGKTDRTHQFFFVNLRPVHDKILSSALNQAYRGILEKDLSPEAFLFLSVPYGEVDVNVHPAKSEVRFSRSSAIFQLVLRSVTHGRLRVGGIKEVTSVSAGSSEAGWPEPLERGIPFKVDEGKARFELPDFAVPGEVPSAGSAEKPARRVLGQFADAYIVAEDAEGLLVVDQHNAHERVLFDKYAEIDRRRKWPVKMSLIPLLFDLTPSQVVSLESGQEMLQESGFRVEAMGGRSYALREYPDVFQPEEALEAVHELLDEIKDGPAEDKKARLLATMACKTAIKAGQPLPREKMEFLVQELFKTANPALCPHGRPIVVRIAKSQIEKGLRRPVN